MKVGIVGCGGIANIHAECIDSIPEHEVIGFADVERERALQFSKIYGGHAYTSMEDLIDKMSPDILHICTPHYLHVPMSIAALKKGIHVFQEKPAAISFAEYNDLKLAAKESKAYLAICYQNRYNDSTQAAFNYINTHKSGRLLGGRAFLTWDRDETYYSGSTWRGHFRTEGGGVLINQAVHTLDLLSLFMGRAVQVEASMGSHHLKSVIEVEDTVEAFITYDKAGESADAVFYATTANRQNSDPLIEIYYENYSIRIEGSGLFVRRNSEEIWVCQRISEYLYNHHNVKRDTSVSKPKTDRKVCNCSPDLDKRRVYWGDSHDRAIRAFYRTVETGEDNCISIENTDVTNQLMLCMYDSARKGIVIKMCDPISIVRGGNSV